MCCPSASPRPRRTRAGAALRERKPGGRKRGVRGRRRSGQKRGARLKALAVRSRPRFARARVARRALTATVQTAFLSSLRRAAGRSSSNAAAGKRGRRSGQVPLLRAHSPAKQSEWPCAVRSVFCNRAGRHAWPDLRGSVAINGERSRPGDRPLPLHEQQQAHRHHRHAADEAVDGKVVFAVFPRRGQQFVKGDEHHDAGHGGEEDAEHRV